MKKLLISTLSIFMILFLVSCGSKPTPETETTEIEPPQIEEITEQLPEIEEVIEEIKKIDNTAAIAGMDLSRDEAISLNAKEYLPYLFTALEDEYASLKARADAGEDISKESAELAKRYQALAAAAKASRAKEIIDDSEMAYILQRVYDEGCLALDEYYELFDSDDATADQELAKATKAYTSLNTVLLAVYKQAAKDMRVKALDAKKDADSVKAAVSEKARYTEAADLFKKGDTNLSMQNSEKAYDNYEASYNIFTVLFNEITEKRAAALAAIEAAKKKVEESAAIAEKADLESPISGNPDGIEDEDAVLLDEDEYANPEDAEIDLAEELNLTGDAK